MTLPGLDILIVEDNKDSACRLRAILSRANALVRIASSARDGLALAKERVPAVVLTDLHMSGEDGYWLLHALRREFPLRIPVVVVTSADDDGRLLRNGFDSYMQKPVEPEELLRIVAWLAFGPTMKNGRVIQGGVGRRFPVSVVESKRLVRETALLIDSSRKLRDSSLDVLARFRAVRIGFAA